MNRSSLQRTLDVLSSEYGSRLETSNAIRDHHGASESWLAPAAPDAVFKARTTEEVATVLGVCNKNDVAVIPFGAGSSLEGQVHATRGGICVDLSEMNTVMSVNQHDMDCVVQAGVVRQDLNEHLRETGLFFPVDLSARATLGGMASTRASGTTTVRYGSMRELVLGLTVVLPDGQIIKTGGRARKSSADTCGDARQMSGVIANNRKFLIALNRYF